MYRSWHTWAGAVGRSPDTHLRRKKRAEDGAPGFCFLSRTSTRQMQGFLHSRWSVEMTDFGVGL